MKSLQELCEMEHAELEELCYLLEGWRVDSDAWSLDFHGKFYARSDEEEDIPSHMMPKYCSNLNECEMLESILLSQPNPTKMSPGEQATPLQRYEYALTALEPEKPLWAKSARTKTISFIYSQQTV